MNTLDLDPEWGAIDLLEEVEASFAIKIEDAVVERIATVGELYDAICNLTPAWDDQKGSCASSVTFYRIRRALKMDCGGSMSPRMDLPLNYTSPSKFFSTLERDSGLRLPTTNGTAIGNIGIWLCVFSLAGCITALFASNWTLAAGAALTAAVGVGLVRVDPGKSPVGIETVGDLVKRTIPLNIRQLADGGARLPDRWSVLTGLASEHGVLPPAEIEPDTFLHHKSLELATKSF